MRAALPLLLILTACSRSVAPDQLNSADNPTQSQMDSAAARIHSNMLLAMGGEEAWQKARYFEFDFVPVRQGQERARWRHRWDRWRGDYRLSGVRNGDTIVAIFNLNDPKAGRVTVNGAQVTAATRDTLLTFAYARHINDSYWLIMPYKWRDAGVIVTYQGRQVDDTGKTWDVVKLTFADVGLTPQNQYLALVNPQTALMERWYHFEREGARSSMFDWTGWQRFGPIMLATEKPALDGNSMIRFDNVRVLTSVPAAVFEF
ncbi:MAG: hypothetical protein ACT4O1_07785 [Gemmatimonadota bacterium]